MYTYGIFDPRPQGEESNLAMVAEKNVFGIEVTVHKLAEFCNLGNLDPQHSEGEGANQAAIEAAMAVELPQDGALLATIRPDLDSVGTMGLLTLRAQDGEEVLSPGLRNRVAQIAAVDKATTGPWYPRKLPSYGELWESDNGHEMAALASIIGDFKLSIADRVAVMTRWLRDGIIPSPFYGNYSKKVLDERMALVAALQDGTIKYTTTADGRIAVVESAHRAATTVGYSLAPIVVAENPQFIFNGGAPHRKITICQFSGGYVDLKEVLAELNGLEDGWGGSPTIGGSPQGVSSSLPTSTILEVVRKHLL